MVHVAVSKSTSSKVMKKASPLLGDDGIPTLSASDLHGSAHRDKEMPLP
jgi:hypothetical protein